MLSSNINTKIKINSELTSESLEESLLYQTKRTIAMRGRRFCFSILFRQTCWCFSDMGNLPLNQANLHHAETYTCLEDH